MTVKIGVNGFGRIGRACIRIAEEHPDVEVVAFNSTRDPEMLAHLLKYDSLYGRTAYDVQAADGALVINGREVKILADRDPSKLNWGDHGVDIVVEATGAFRDAQEAGNHLGGSAKKVIITAPGKNEDYTIVMGVNEEDYNPEKHHIISNASCTTNCLAPVCKVLDNEFGFVKGLMTTIHAYTNDQRILDLTHKDLRRARAAGLSMIPTTTGAARAVSVVLPGIKGKIDGFAVRVPTPTVSLVDLVAELDSKVTAEDVNNAFRRAAQGPMQGVLGISDEPLVSVDYKGDPRSSVVDALSTMVIQDNMVKVVSWYDNEWAYAYRVIDLAAYLSQKGL
ncbi:type I glyceraldehyde-3-phosphate dehydrogenase [Dethiobacter alkaliphilus]|uniref:type I glyceraldehyde-3-phosphate dehydrogenase n=1 Tax=Dethiobacter alkaliphilus TaxID=427926 RepID=UPI002227437C|nr:type I glyceraldehyde-3-phosphate dehydrogenase [Dethiobacter alkaliphilus]MCW3488611.1 type I glyceraldehyde-3-phosphate dehydrogenase [Dethiobacter alkaliphilus]